MSEMQDNVKAAAQEVIAKAQEEMKSLIAKILSDAKGDVKTYAVAIAEAYGKMLLKSIGKDDAVIDRNLKHLRAQALLLAAKNSLAIHKETQEAIKRVLEASAKILLKALVVALAAI